MSLYSFLETYIFHGPITLDGVVSLLVSVFAVSMTIIGTVAKNKSIKAKRDLTASETAVIALREEQVEMKKVMSYFADIISIAFLSSPTLNVEVKYAISRAIADMKKISKVDMSQFTEQLLVKLSEHDPEANLHTKRQEILTVLKNAEDAGTQLSTIADSLVGSFTEV